MIIFFVSLAKVERFNLLLCADESWTVTADLLQATRVDHARNIANTENTGLSYCESQSYVNNPYFWYRMVAAKKM
jgi:hypothetical protein